MIRGAMKGKLYFLLFILFFFFGACAPKKFLPPALEPAGPPAEEVLTGPSLLDAAETLYAQKKYPEARERYAEYLRRFPQSENAAAAWMRIGEIDMRLQQFETARQAFQTVIDVYSKSPWTAEAMIRKLETFNQEERYRETIAYSFEIPDTRLSQPQVFKKDILLGDAFLATGSYADAFYFYSQVYTRADGDQKNQTLAKLRDVLPHLSMIHTENLLNRLKDPVLRGHLLYQLGLLNIESNRTEYAILALSKLVKQYPNHEQAESAENLLKMIYLSSISSPYTIGCMLPLSGPYKLYGNRAMAGVELALNQYNKQHPKTPVRILFKDTASDPRQAVKALQELDSEKVAAVIGPIITAEDAAHEAQNRGIPIMLFTQKHAITQIGNFVFRNFITPEMQMKAMAQYAITQRGLRRFAILYPDENYGRTFMNLFWDNVLDLGGNIAGVERYDPELTDFADPIKKLVGLFYDIPDYLQVSFKLIAAPIDELNASTPYDALWPALYDTFFHDLPALFYQWQPMDTGPLAAKAGENPAGDQEPKPIVDFDAVFIPDAPQKAGLIIPQLAYYDIEDVVLMGTNLWHSKDLLNMSGRYIQGAVFPDGFSADSDAYHVQAFTHAFEKTFGRKPGFMEAVAYDSADIILSLLSGGNIRFRSELKDELLNLVDFRGVTGRTAFDYQGDALKKLYILRITGNRFVEVEIP